MTEDLNLARTTVSPRRLLVPLALTPGKRDLPEHKSPP
jgi:hypothetical protein